MQQATFVNVQYQASKGNPSFLLMQIILLQSARNLDKEYPFYLQIDLEDFSTCSIDTVNKGISHLKSLSFKVFKHMLLFSFIKGLVFK